MLATFIATLILGKSVLGGVFVIAVVTGVHGSHESETVPSTDEVVAICDGDKDFVADPVDNRVYFECNNGKIIKRYTCPGETRFSERHRKCIEANSGEDDITEAEDRSLLVSVICKLISGKHTFVVQVGDRKYVACDHGNFTGISTCGEGEMYVLGKGCSRLKSNFNKTVSASTVAPDSVSEIDDEVVSVSTKAPCASTGEDIEFVAHSNDRRKYQVCHQGRLLYTGICEQGTYFYQNANGCTNQKVFEIGAGIETNSLPEGINGTLDENSIATNRTATEEDTTSEFVDDSTIPSGQIDASTVTSSAAIEEITTKHSVTTADATKPTSTSERHRTIGTDGPASTKDTISSQDFSEKTDLSNRPEAMAVALKMAPDVGELSSTTKNSIMSADVTDARTICPPKSLVVTKVPHESDCSSFYFCFNGVPVISYCESGKLFSERKSACVPPDESDCPPHLRCRKDTCMDATSDHDNCKRFYFCRNGEPNFSTCPSDLLFNTASRMCDIPSSVVCGERKKLFSSYASPHLQTQMGVDVTDFDGSWQCPELNGRFADESNCTRFYKCFDGVPHMMKCSDYKVYSRLSKSCVNRRLSTACISSQ